MKKISRRNFLENTGKGLALVSASIVIPACSLNPRKNLGQVPRRILGKTGINASILSFGGGSQWCKNKDGEWEKMLEEALENGVNLFDTAPSYSKYMGEGHKLTSEEQFGTIPPEYRDQITLITKLESRNPKKVRKEVEGSLSRLKTDYIDIYLIHAVNDSDHVSEIEKGIYNEMVSLKKAGVVKHIGFSSMDSAERSRDLLENLDIDVAMLAMNATQYGDYAKVALPAARKQNTGVIAMKVMRNIVGKGATPKELLEYAWTQEGVSSAIIAHYGAEVLKENIRLAEEYAKSPSAGINRKGLEMRMAQYAGPHALCWAQPGYCDGEPIA